MKTAARALAVALGLGVVMAAGFSLWLQYRALLERQKADKITAQIVELVVTARQRAKIEPALTAGVTDLVAQLRQRGLLSGLMIVQDGNIHFVLTPWGTRLQAQILPASATVPAQIALTAVLPRAGCEQLGRWVLERGGWLGSRQLALRRTDGATAQLTDMLDDVAIRGAVRAGCGQGGTVTWQLTTLLRPNLS